MKPYKKNFIESVPLSLIKYAPNEIDFEKFCTSLKTFIEKVNSSIQHNQTEENLKEHFREFLLESFYRDTNIIETKSYKGQIQADLAIFQTTKNNSPVEVLIEVKKPSNKAEMISLNDLNKKALHEAVFYYLFEKIECKNNELKHLIITNLEEVYIFDAQDIEKAFYDEGKSQLAREFIKWKNKVLDNTNTSLFYEIIKSFISSSDTEIPFAYIDLKHLETEKLLIQAYKILCSYNLLKKSVSNDSNTLNREFYEELLHIMGLEEKSAEKGNKLLIQRKSVEKRNEGSFIEDLISKMKRTNKLRQVDNMQKWGANQEDQLKNIALELSITWINRILFLKLLEAQLFKYHNKDDSFLFLNTKKISNWSDISFLFFEVLAKKTSERVQNLKGFDLIPYLNSSLFEETELERTFDGVDTITSCLTQNAIIPVLEKTILKDSQNKQLKNIKLSTLEYLLNFLSAYDFGIEDCEEVKKESKTIINASVLGLIFEKINGYKDGSFFTPPYITMYMCRETIRRAVLENFNQKYNLTCQSIEELSEEIYRSKISLKEANELIDNLRICDPAVGSGHFLVSALNEIIAIKSDLDILIDENGKSLGKYYKAYIEHDELLVSDLESNELFDYRVASFDKRQGKRNVSIEKTRVQKTIFHEKQKIIENCLFGVDINPNSVQICCLRLWIELLKNAYYIPETNYLELQTLPNIDINIKQGNSLISRLDLKQPLVGIPDAKDKINTLIQATKKYKNTTDKNEKELLDSQIKEGKRILEKAFLVNNPDHQELINLQAQNADLLPEKQKQKRQQRIEELEKKINNIDLSSQPFEWRYEFPEVLDESGNFTGFDMVIGNPPYITILLGKKQEYNIDQSNYYKNRYQTFEYKGNTYVLFIELGNSLLKNQGLLSYIIPNTLLLSDTYSKVRQYLLTNQQLIKLTNCEFKVFKEAEVGGTLILLAERTKLENKETFGAYNFPKYFFDNNKLEKIDQSKYVHTSSNKFYLNNKTIEILSKSIAGSKRYGDLVKLYQGIITGDNEMFISDQRKTNKYVKILRGKDIHRYNYNFSSNYVLFDKSKLWSNTDESNFLPEKIISRQTSDCLIGAYDTEQFFTLDSTHVHTIIDNKVSLKYLLALFNSKFMNYLYKLMVKEEGRIFAQVKTVVLKELPIKYIPTKEQKPFIDLVETILSLKEQNKDTKKLEEKIDKLVYKLYELTEEEIKIIEESSK